MSLEILTFPVGVFQCNCSVVWCKHTGEALVIDPGDEAPQILNQIKTQGLTVKYLLHTHAHIDHVMATKAVSQATGAQIALHQDDLFLYQNLDLQAQVLRFPKQESVLPVQIWLEANAEFEIGKSGPLKVLHTPGHTPGSCCFYLSALKTPVIFSGDTLFLQSIGRTDLWGGDSQQILASIREKLLILPINSQVICGHGPNTTLAHEARYNSFLQV